MTNSVSLPKLLPARHAVPAYAIAIPRRADRLDVHPARPLLGIYPPLDVTVEPGAAARSGRPEHRDLEDMADMLLELLGIIPACAGSTAPRWPGARTPRGTRGGATCTRRTRRTRRSTRRPSRCCSGLLGTVEISRVDPRPLGVPAHDRVDEPVRTGAVREPEVV